MSKILVQTQQKQSEPEFVRGYPTLNAKTRLGRLFGIDDLRFILSKESHFLFIPYTKGGKKLWKELRQFAKSLRPIKEGEFNSSSNIFRTVNKPYFNLISTRDGSSTKKIYGLLCYVSGKDIVNLDLLFGVHSREVREITGSNVIDKVRYKFSAKAFVYILTSTEMNKFGDVRRQPINYSQLNGLSVTPPS